MSGVREGLEISIVPMSKVLRSARTLRLDPEYFQKQHLADAELISSQGNAFKSLDELLVEVDASAFYPSIEEYYGVGSFPFYRVGDVDGMIDLEGAERIPAELCDQFPTLKKVLPGDILFTKGGAIDRAGYVLREGAVSRDLIFLNTSRLVESARLALFAYFQTALFRRMLLRSSSQTAQPHLTVTLVRDLPVFVGSDELNEAVASAIVKAYRHADVASSLMQHAGDVLLAELGLADWSPPVQLAYTARASDVLAAGRIDAQYFRPLFAEVERRLVNSGRAVKLGGVLTTNTRGSQPLYREAGLPVINSKHVRTNRVVLTDNREAIELPSAVVIQRGDVLLNGTGVGTIGRAAAYLHEQPAIPDNHVTVLRSSHVDPLYLAAFLNSPLGQWQIERHIKGSSGQIELYPSDISKLVFWDAPEEVQLKVRDAVTAAFAEESHSRTLLWTAIRAVEASIATGEGAAMDLLRQAEGTH